MASYTRVNDEAMHILLILYTTHTIYYSYYPRVNDEAAGEGDAHIQEARP